MLLVGVHFDLAERLWIASRSVERFEIDELALSSLFGVTAFLAYQNLRLRSILRLRRTYAPHGLVAMCAHCRSVRDEGGEWRDVGTVLRDLSELQVSHGICTRCEAIHHS